MNRNPNITGVGSAYRAPVTSATADHVIAVRLKNTVSEGNAVGSSGSASGTAAFGGNTMTINVTGVPKAQQITLSLTKVKDGFCLETCS